MNHQLSLELPTSNSQAREDFVVSDANRNAFNHLSQYPDWPSPLALIVGPTKTGKTHLARIFAQRNSGVFLGLECETDENFLSRASQNSDMPLVIDDFERLSVSEDVLFHTVNSCMHSGRFLVMTARTNVTEWAFKTDDLKSRATLAVNLKLQQPDDAQLSQILVKLLADRQMSTDTKTVDYLVARMERSAAEVVALVQVLDELSLSQGRAITRPLAAEALKMRQTQK